MIKLIMENLINQSVLYHSVFDKKALDFVLKNGIVADEQGFIYLSEKPFDNAYAVFTVKIPNKNNLYDWEDFWLDDNGNEIDFNHEYNSNNKYYMYMGDIPAEYINQIK